MFDHSSFRARSPREVFGRDIGAPIEGNAWPRIHSWGAGPGSAGETTGTIPVSYFDARRSDHAAEPARSRDFGQIAVPGRCRGSGRRRSVPVVIARGSAKELAPRAVRAWGTRPRSLRL